MCFLVTIMITAPWHCIFLSFHLFHEADCFSKIGTRSSETLGVRRHLTTYIPTVGAQVLMMVHKAFSDLAPTPSLTSPAQPLPHSLASSFAVTQTHQADSCIRALLLDVPRAWNALPQLSAKLSTHFLQVSAERSPPGTNLPWPGSIRCPCDSTGLVPPLFPSLFLSFTAFTTC